MVQQEIRVQLPAEMEYQLSASSPKGEESQLAKYSFWKSIADRITAVVILILTSPVQLLISIMIRLDSQGKAIFAQERVGKNGKLFTVYKYRTMHQNNDETKYKDYISKYVLENAPYRVDDTGEKIFKVDDPHVTRFGKLLRKTNLDELPQFFNVLKGDMSIIGPRPDIPFAVDMYNDYQKKRLEAIPGITGLWQVSSRKSRSFTDMVRLDIFYINKQSLLLDLKIFLATFKVFFKMDGS